MGARRPGHHTRRTCRRPHRRRVQSRHFQVAHIFITTDTEIAGVIDWGDTGIGDRHYDLAVLTVGHDEHLEAVLDGYGLAVDRDRICGYWSWRRLGSVRWMLEHGYDADGDISALAFGV
ncbi:MAG TPA: phosphotransferase [Acidimicrobiales bacterium]|nr:phosphotransferase [Acidimicrobiales bacterium]